jgi:branched-chain amino acid transport system substrate-binding protein
MKMKTNLTIIAAVCAVLATGLVTPGQLSGDVVRLGFATDMSGLYSDIDSSGGVAAIKMAAAHFGGQVDGKKIKLLGLHHHATQRQVEVRAVKGSARMSGR